MKILLIIVLAVLVIGAVVSLVRGIAAFLQSTKEDLDRAPDGGPSPMQLKQNKMMINRILFQAGAVIVVAILLAVAR